MIVNFLSRGDLVRQMGRHDRVDTLGDRVRGCEGRCRRSARGLGRLAAGPRTLRGVTHRGCLVGGPSRSVFIFRR